MTVCALRGSQVLVVSLAMLAGSVALPGSGAADPRDEQERVERKVAEAEATLEHATEQAREAAARYTAADAALPEAQARRDRARGEVTATEVRLRAAERETERTREELTAAHTSVDRSIEAVDRARQGFAGFAVATYKGSRLANLQVLLRASGPAEAVKRYGYLDHVSQQERAAIDELAGARLAARGAENRAAVAFERAETARERERDALAAAEEARDEAERAAREAEELVLAREEAMLDAEAEREASLRRYEKAEAAAERIADEVRQWEARQSAQSSGPNSADSGGGSSAGGSSGGSGALLRMPVQGWQSSPFGMRQDPVYGGTRMHSGIDIAAPGGAPVYAAESGTVIRAGWHGGYGNHTCVSHGVRHGQGLSSCYAHQSEILVTSGESVARGEVIGRVGTTGASTGDHLHFEIRLDGSPTDPIPFLPECLC